MLPTFLLTTLVHVGNEDDDDVDDDDDDDDEEHLCKAFS